jgi:hypothetical protein
MVDDGQDDDPGGADGEAGGPGPDTEWVLALQSRDAVEAEMAERFLADHDVPVRVSGGTTHALPAMGLNDVRILVPRGDLARAQEILKALDQGAPDSHPFRQGAALEPYEKPVERRKWPFAVVLAFCVPIGAGHFYARHGAAGGVLLAGIVGTAFAGIWLRVPELLHATVLIIALDVLLSPFAVRRFNEGKIPPDSTQRLGALGLVVGALVIAFVVPW